MIDSIISKITSYSKDASGWVDGVYRERVEEIEYSNEIECIVENLENSSIIVFNKGYELRSRVWTETEETGFGVYDYIESNGIELELENKNYIVDVVFNLENQMDSTISIRANRLKKIEGMDGSVRNLASFKIAVTKNKLELQMYKESKSTSKLDSVEQSIVINQIRIRKEEVLEQEEDDKIRIYLLSDSTVQTYDDSWAPQSGWGQKLIDCFKLSTDIDGNRVAPILQEKKNYITHKLDIYNKAIGGRSLKSFWNEGRLDEVLLSIEPNDYIFIQFGHNDDTKVRPNRYINTEQYYGYLNDYVDAILQRDGIPVLISPVARRNCDDLGEFKISFNNYREAMIRVSEERNIVFLDLGRESTKILQGIGVEESKKLYMWVEAGAYPESNHKNGVTDNTHLCQAGASLFAGAVSKLIKEYSKDSRLDTIKNQLI